MLYHGAYFSNYMNWLKDPGDYFPSAHLVWTDIGIAQIFLIQGLTGMACYKATPKNRKMELGLLLRPG